MEPAAGLARRRTPSQPARSAQHSPPSSLPVQSLSESRPVRSGVALACRSSPRVHAESAGVGPGRGQQRVRQGASARGILLDHAGLLVVPRRAECRVNARRVRCAYDSPDSTCVLLDTSDLFNQEDNNCLGRSHDIQRIPCNG